MVAMRIIAFFLLLFSPYPCWLSADDCLPSAKTIQGIAQGRWLIESAVFGPHDQITKVWSSVVSISGDGFSISNFLDPTKELKGKIQLDQKDANAFDVSLEELDFASLGEPYKIAASTLKGIIRLDSENKITLAVNQETSTDRPKKFESKSSVFLIRLQRAPTDFIDYPKEIKVSVTNTGGQPVEGAIAARFHQKSQRPGQDLPTLKYFDQKTTDEDGVVMFPYENLPRVIRDEPSKQIAFPMLSPPSLAGGELQVKLAAECQLLGSITCKELEDEGRPIGWTNVYLQQNGNSVASCDSMTGTFDFVVPPGEYQLRAYGSTLNPRILTVTVPADRTTFTVDPIDLKLSELTRLKGKPAPEFVNVAGWHGEPIKLSELKGKYVLVDFWGYWCGPCVGAMPVLIELHEKFSDKGLVIVGVHVDGEGEVDTADKLKEKLTHIVKDIWKGKELPFSNALVSGKEEGEGDQLLRVGTPSIYGILNYPTTILIDREGVIVGQFHAGDIDSATTKIEELLGIKPKQ